MVYKCNDHVQKYFEIQKTKDAKDRSPLDMVVCFPVLEFNREARKQHPENKKQSLDGFK